MSSRSPATVFCNREKIVSHSPYACHWHHDGDPHIPFLSFCTFITIDSLKALHLFTLALHFFRTSLASITLWLWKWKQMCPQTRDKIV